MSETKLDRTFPNSQFYIQGFRMSSNDKNIHGDALMAFVRSDICSTLVKDLENLSVADWSLGRGKHREHYSISFLQTRKERS